MQKLRVRLAAVPELLLAGLLIWGTFAPIPFGNTVSLLLLGSASLWLRGSDWKSIGLRQPQSWPRSIGWGVVLGFAVQILDIYFITPLLSRLTGHPPDVSMLRSMAGNVRQLLFWLGVTWTIAAFGEEMVYRGYILNRAAGLFGGKPSRWVFAAIISSALFALGHRYQGVAGTIDIFFFALIPVLAYLVSGRNLWITIVMHGVADSIGFVLIFLGRYPGL